MFKKFATILLVVIFISTVVGVGDIYAGWDDNSGNLPGNDGTQTAIVIIGGVVVAGLLLYMLVNRGGDEDHARLNIDHPADVAISVHPAAQSVVYAAQYGVASRKHVLDMDPIIYVNQGRVGAGLQLSF